jgi:uncharacterized protein RhaS with RHS repeats
MYTPHVGRWLSKDPAGFVDGPNQYLYVKNAPPGAVDPSGFRAFTSRWSRDREARAIATHWATWHNRSADIFTAC